MNKQLLNLLQLTEQQYNEFLFDAACEYAEHYLGVENAKTFISNSAYWVWYTNAFEASNLRFLSKYMVGSYTLDFLQSKWYRIHDPKYMEVYPSPAVIRYAGGILKGKKVKA